MRRSLFVAALSLSASLALAVAAAPARASVDATITGVVEDALVHPLAGAIVIVHDASGNIVAKAVTGPDGKFKFAALPLGDYTVEASYPGLVGDHQHLQLTSSQLAPVELQLVDGNEVISVNETWDVAAPTRATGSVVTLSRQALQELPGADDRPVTDVVVTQPGFVADALGNVYARGNHANIQYQIDGIPVPDSVGSLFAASIPVRLVQSVEILTGGMPAEFGDRLGAVVNLTTRHGGEHPEGAVQLRYGSYNTIAPGFAYATRVTDHTAMFVGGSVQSSARAIDPPSIDPILHDAGYTARGFARFDYTPCDANHYEVFATFAHNRFQIPIDPAVAPLDPAQPMATRPVDQYGNASPAFVPRDTDASETETELFAAFSWVHKLDHDRGQLQLAPIYKLSRGALVADAGHALGALADPGSTASDVIRTAQHAGGFATYSLQRGRHLFRTGVQADLLVGRTSFVAYARDDASAQGGVDAAATQRGVDHTNALTLGAYAQDHWASGRFALDVGLRVDTLHVALGDGRADDQVGVGPRTGASYALTKDAIVHAFAGINWQPPAPLDAANAARALGVVPATETITYDLKPETDLYGELGATLRPSHTLRTGLVAWGRYAYDQLDDTAIGSTSLLSNYNFERGRAFGVEASGELRVGPWLSAFANGSVGRAQGRGIASARYLFSPAVLANTAWQTLDHAQSLTANAGATVRDGRFAITGLASYGSGLRTGPANTAHVPGHVRADLAMQYTFAPRAYPIRVGIDVINLFDAHYAYRIANGFVGSSYAAPRTVFLSLSLPLAPEPHHPGE